MNVSDYFANIDDAFSNSFSCQVQITDPYDSTATSLINIDLNTVLRCFLAYSGAGQLTNSSTTINQIRFAYSNYGMGLDGKPLFNNTENYYFMFPHTFVKIYNEPGFDVTTIYNYQTTLYYAKTQTSLF